MSNFDFLRSHFPGIYDKVKIAETRVFTEPKSAAHYCRMALEGAVHHIFEAERIQPGYDQGLASLMRHPQFRDLLPEEFQEGLFIIRKTGNAGAHYGHRVKGREALISIQYLFDFLKWFANFYADIQPNLPPSFDKSLIPKVGESNRKLRELAEEARQEQQKLAAQIEELARELEAQQNAAKESEEALLRYKKELKETRQQFQLQKAQRQRTIPSTFTEAETRMHLIDLALREAGWDNLQEGKDLEFPVTGMPVTPDNPRGNGACDYVLWDDNGLPLAVIEAKRTTKSPDAGRHQAWLYANALEARYSQRPLIFYTNGYKTYLWDDTFYTLPRRVYGFYTRDELAWAIQKRKTRKDVRTVAVNPAISGRPYQLEAIQRLSESLVIEEQQTGLLRGRQRHALLVMATGSGKTRVSASVVDVLFRANWVRRVLFLADRNALVTQARNAFAEHLPHLSSIDLTREKENNTTRLVFSTYPSIMNKIDGERSGEERFYGVGHFDLIIVDEAHRSVYNRYGAIFEYFDAMLMGLTATPRKEIDRNTYELFECSEGNPTFAYELEEAVQNGFLVPYQNINLSTQFLREGIRYRDLSEEEKAEYEEEFRDNATGLFPEEIHHTALNRWLFNKNTVHQILDALMEHGLKIENGDKIGRTIIFAVNQTHAEFILECFEQRYPQFPSGFMAVVHNKVSHAQSLIQAFCDPHQENLPQIAVSVDMLDTGIDAPRVLNLVFFKKVRSYAKFWQMIGRGTRLCPDIYGPGRDKDHFLIFDVGGNFEFFEEKQHGVEGPYVKPVTQRIFMTRLAVARLLMETGEEEDRKLAEEFLDMLHAAILALDHSRFDVGMVREYVDEFSERSRWNRLDEENIHRIETYLAHLPVPESINEKARRWDLMMLKMMQADLLMSDKLSSYRESVLEIAEGLSMKYAIPQVHRSKVLIEQLRDPEFYRDLTRRKMEEIRVEIRELVQYLEEQGREMVRTDFEDQLTADPVGDYRSPASTNALYKLQVERFIRENRNHVTIAKLNTNKPITREEIQELERILFDGGERGTLEQFRKTYGDEPLGRFIRNIVGLDIRAAQEAFSEFIQSGNLSADQMKFIDTIIQYLNRNGTIDKALLFEPPFTHMDDEGLFGIFDDAKAMKIVHLLERINENAEAR